MKIILQSLSKRFNYEWIFQDVNIYFEKGKSYALTGPNGSGKTTLLKIISGQLSPSVGKIKYIDDEGEISPDLIYEHISFAAPYIDLIEDFSLDEMIQFHKSFKKINLHTEQIKQYINVQAKKNKLIKYFSSGMKQRVKLALNILNTNEIVLLDEPTSNLDRAGVEWYLKMAEEFFKNKIVILGSNLEREYSFCSEIVSMNNYRK